MSRPILVREITQTCFACPSQWEGTTHDGENLYVRFRFGTLRVDLNGETVYRWDAADSWDGVMDYDRLRNLTRHLIVWPDECGDYVDEDLDEFVIEKAALSILVTGEAVPRPYD